MSIDVLAAEAAGYRWLDPHRARTAQDPDLAATVARLFTELEDQRQRAETAEQALHVQQVAVRALTAELHAHNVAVDAREGV